MAEISVRPYERKTGAVRGHVRHLPEVEYQRKQAQERRREIGDVTALVSDPSAGMLDAAFDIALQESIEATPKVPNRPHVIENPQQGWVDAANTRWGDIPQNTEYAAEVRTSVGEILDELAAQTCFVSTHDGKPITNPDVLRNIREKEDGARYELIGMADFEEMSDSEVDALASRIAGYVVPHNPPERTTDTGEPIVSLKVEVMTYNTAKAVALIAIEALRDGRGLTNMELRNILRSQVARGQRSSSREVKDKTELLYEVCGGAHDMWRGSRSGADGAEFPVPLVYEDSYGRLIDVHANSDAAPKRVREHVASLTQQELKLAGGVNRSTGLFGGRAAKARLAEELYVNEKLFALPLQGKNLDYAWRREREEYHKLTDGEKHKYIERAAVRIRQARKLGRRKMV